MGVWMIATGVLRIEPEPDDALIRDYIYFSENTNPYKEMEEHFPNPWFFDSDNHLQCAAGKFAEPSVWLNYIRKFFGERGYRVIGDPEIEGEFMASFWEVCKEKERQYEIWKDRKKSLVNNGYDK